MGGIRCAYKVMLLHNLAFFPLNVVLRIVGSRCKVKTTALAYLAYSGFEVHCTHLMSIAELQERK